MIQLRSGKVNTKHQQFESVTDEAQQMTTMTNRETTAPAQPKFEQDPKPKRPCFDIRYMSEMSEAQKVDIMFKWWPSGDHDCGYPTSGINCLIVLLKTIYSYIVNPLWDTEDPAVREMEKSNPFMAHAWLGLLAQCDVGAALDNLIATVYGTSLDKVTLSQLEFKNLVSGLQMNLSLWTMTQFNPMLPMVWSHRNAHRMRDWHEFESKDTPESVKECLGSWYPKPSPKSFRFDAFPGMRVDAEVNKFFGQFSVDDYEVLIRPNAPQFFFATFDVKNVTEEEKLSFDTFRRLTLAVGKFIKSQGKEIWTKTKLETYSLIALVKSRSKDEDCDTIRVYDKLGQHLKYDVNPGRYATPTWRMADMKNGDSFLALYVHSRFPPKSDPPFREIGIKKDTREFDGREARVTELIRGGPRRNIL